MAVALSANELDRTIKVLSSAVQTLQLSRLERITYRALLISVDVALVSFFGCILTGILAAAGMVSSVPAIVSDPSFYLALALGLVFVVSFGVALISLALNIPLLIKTFRERRRLDQLGLGTLYTSVWKENRRTRWISRLRSALLLGIGIAIIVGMVFVSKGLLEANTKDDRILFAVLLLFWSVTASLLFGARYLRNQREQMDLAASAEQLKADLQKRREQDRPNAGSVVVPSEILERSAVIESAQIRMERKDAVLQSATLRESTYAITFEPNAAEQRIALDRADRLELEDLVADLSAEGRKVKRKLPQLRARTPGRSGARPKTSMSRSTTWSTTCRVASRSLP
jgi:hypothetical protein